MAVESFAQKYLLCKPQTFSVIFIVFFPSSLFRPSYCYIHCIIAFGAIGSATLTDAIPLSFSFTIVCLCASNLSHQKCKEVFFTVILCVESKVAIVCFKKIQFDNTFISVQHIKNFVDSKASFYLPIICSINRHLCCLSLI